MSDTPIAPCHVCGEPPRVAENARGMLGDNAWKVTCHPSTAIYESRAAAVAAWNRDARAREVLHAVDALERVGNSFDCQPDIGGWAAGSKRHSGFGDTPADALVALVREQKQ